MFTARQKQKPLMDCHEINLLFALKPCVQIADSFRDNPLKKEMQKNANENRLTDDNIIGRQNLRICHMKKSYDFG